MLTGNPFRRTMPAAIAEKWEGIGETTPSTPLQPGRSLRILSLDGGGVRGLSSLLTLKRLMYTINRQKPPKPCDIFHLMGGTSTGGCD